MRLMGQEDFTVYQSQLSDRFGFSDSLWSRFCVHQPTTKGWYLTPVGYQVPAALRIDASGLFFYKTAVRFPKLSTAAAMLLGRYATKHIVQLDAQGRDAFLAKEEQILANLQCQQLESTGYVLVCYQTFFLGVGLYLAPTAHHKTHRLQSMVDTKLAR